MKKNRRIFWILLIILLSYIAVSIVPAENEGKQQKTASKEKEREQQKMDKDSPLLLHVVDLKDPVSLAVKLWKPQTFLSQYLRETFSLDTQRLLDEYDGLKSPSEALQMALVNELNRLIQGECIYDEQRFAQVELTEGIQKLIEKDLQLVLGEDLIRLNRLLLEEAYPNEIAESGKDFFLGYTDYFNQDGKGITTLRGNVRIYRYDGYMYADKVTLYRDVNTNEVIKTLAEDNVELRDKDILAYCDQTVFNEVNDTIELTGSVVVTQGEDRVEAAYLKYNRNTGERFAERGSDSPIKFRVKIKTKEEEFTKESESNESKSESEEGK